MTILTQWELEPRVIVTTYTHSPTLNDLRNANANIIAHIRAGTPPVHHVLDATQLHALPLQMPELLDTLSFIYEDGFGWQVFVGRDHIVRFLAEAITRLTDANIELVSTLEAGLEFLFEVDSSLHA
ncbi:MAG: hypothetical protein ACLFTK_17645 [Anaerolineales bacterium]